MRTLILYFRTGLLLIALWPLSLPAAVNMDYAGNGNPFIEAMLAMMDAMGLRNNNYSQPLNTAQMMYPGMSTLPMSGMPMTGSMPMTGMPTSGMPMNGFNNMQQPLQSFTTMSPQMKQMTQPLQTMQGNMPGIGKQAGQSSQLNGVWLGQQGDTLQIQGDYFVLSSRHSGRSLSGQIQTKGQYLLLYIQSSGSKQLYQYAIDQGRMVLRDRQGNLLLYRLQTGH